MSDEPFIQIRVSEVLDRMEKAQLAGFVRIETKLDAKADKSDLTDIRVKLDQKADKADLAGIEKRLDEHASKIGELERRQLQDEGASAARTSRRNWYVGVSATLSGLVLAGTSMYAVFH